MTFAGQVAMHIPFYVWLLFAYVGWQGAQALRPRTQPLAHVFLVPLLFIVSGIVPLLVGPPAGTGLLEAWLLAAVVVGPIGFLTGPRLLAVDRGAGTVTRPGSWVPLVRNVTVFVLQYAIAVAIAVHTDSAGWLSVGGHAVSGATAGYFIGWVVAAGRQYLATPRS